MLVADSYDGVRKACSRYLGHFNFQVSEVANGEDALELISSTLPHVILTESTLPMMPASRLISQEMEPNGWADRAAGVLVKPFTLAEMLEEIRRVLRALDPT